MVANGRGLYEIHVGVIINLISGVVVGPGCRPCNSIWKVVHTGLLVREANPEQIINSFFNIISSEEDFSQDPL